MQVPEVLAGIAPYNFHGVQGREFFRDRLFFDIVTFGTFGHR
jgi:hypothetical protein